MGAVADTVKYFCWASAGVFTFFAIALLVDPEAFFGPNSVLCYYTEWDAATTWFGKGLGVVILSSVWSPYYAYAAPGPKRERATWQPRHPADMPTNLPPSDLRMAAESRTSSTLAGSCR